MNESPGALELISNRVDELERRVHALEHPDPANMPVTKPAVATTTAKHDAVESFQAASVFPLLGRATLGIGGGYLLRAVAESGALPKSLVAAAAIVYALAWLVLSARASRSPGVVPLVYIGTAVTILMPMLWEETLEFHVFAPITTAGVLAVFVGTAAVLEWRRESSPILWIVSGFATAAAMALAVATHAIIPFVTFLLLVVLICEIARGLGHSCPMWPLFALAADAMIWGMIFIYSGPSEARTAYPEQPTSILLLPALSLFLINATSIAGRVFLKRSQIKVFEIVQLVIVVGLVVASVRSFAPSWTMILGAACLTLSAATYWASFQYLCRLEEPRNFRVFSLWSSALLVAGALWCFPRPGATMGLAIAGVVAYWVAEQRELPVLELQGGVFLFAAVVISEMMSYVASVLVGAQPDKTSFSVWIVGGAAMAAYFASADTAAAAGPRQAVRIAVLLVGASASIALMVRGMLMLAQLAFAMNAPHMAFLRTLAISIVSLLLAFAGSRWGRITMTRLAYLLLALLAVKLIFEDLRHGQMGFIAGSMFLFALTLIAVPRLVSMGAKGRASLQPSLTAAAKGD